MHKLIVCRKRPSGMAPEAFAAALQDEQPRRAAGVAGVQSYRQSLALPQGYARREPAYDSIEEFEFASAVIANHAAQSPAWTALFTGSNFLPSDARVIAAQAHVIKDAPPASGMVKALQFVRRRPGLAVAAFHDYWRHVHGPLASLIPSLHRYEQIHFRSNPDGDAGDDELGIAVTWFASLATMKQGAGHPAVLATARDEPNFLDRQPRPLLLMTEQVMFGE